MNLEIAPTDEREDGVIKEDSDSITRRQDVALTVASDIPIMKLESPHANPVSDLSLIELDTQLPVEQSAATSHLSVNNWKWMILVTIGNLGMLLIV